MPAPPKLVWRCRRGMREMDILLGRYLERAYDRLSSAERATLDRLLDCPDQDIFAWLSTDRVPSDPELASLVADMRRVVRVSSH